MRAFLFGCVLGACALSGYALGSVLVQALVLPEHVEEDSSPSKPGRERVAWSELLNNPVGEVPNWVDLRRPRHIRAFYQAELNRLGPNHPAIPELRAWVEQQLQVAR